MKRRRWSSVWDCFEQEGNFVRCKKCEAVLKYTGGCTTHMMYHMGKHGSESTTAPEGETSTDTEAPGPQEESVSQSESSEGLQVAQTTDEPCTDSGERRRSRRSSVWDIFVKVDDGVQCTMCNTKLKYMSSTSNMMYHIKNKHTPDDEKRHAPDLSHLEVTHLICRMIEKDMLPVSVVDGNGFRELLSYIAQNYKIPSQGEITSRIETHFQEKIQELRVLLSTVEMVALATDCWTALPAERYVTVTCHFITDNWQARSAVLQTHSTSVSHTDATVDNLTKTLTETVEAWGITGRVIACVHNNAQSILPAHACARVTWDSVACFASTLQLAVSDGLSDDVLGVIVAAGKLVKHFNHSSLASKALEIKQAQMRLPQHRLIQSNKVRWVTICDMFERLVEQRWAIKAVLSDRMVTNRQEAQALEIEDDYWQTIEDITPVLATLKWATTVMSTETEVSISNIYPITFSLLQNHLAAKEHDSRQVSEFKLKVRESLRQRMEVDSKDLASKPALIASMLDPRHKHLSFLTPSGRLTAKMKLLEIVSKVDAIATVVGTKTEQQETLVTPPVSQATAQQQKGGDTKNAMMLLLGDNYSSSYANDSEAQVDYYLRDISPSLDINPLDWWRVNGPRFPCLATLARRYLCIPGISVPSDRIFSEAGQTFTRQCTRLNPEHVNMLIFLNQNV